MPQWEPGYPEPLGHPVIEEEIAQVIEHAAQITAIQEATFEERLWAPIQHVPPPEVTSAMKLATKPPLIPFGPKQFQAAAKAQSQLAQQQTLKQQSLQVTTPGEESLMEMYSAFIQLLFVLLMFQMMMGR